MYTAYVLGGEKHAERALLTYIDKKSYNNETAMRFFNEVLVEGKKDREFVLKNQKIDFETLIKGDPNKVCKGKCKTTHNMRIWDVLNEKLYKHHESYVVYFEDWLDRLETKEAKELYMNSPYQHAGDKK
jgi:hypothetical protein